VTTPAHFQNPSDVAKRFGLTVKALRLYEQRGLVTPRRTAAGWRVYGPDEMTRLAEIVALRELGLSIGQIGQVLGADASCLESALAAHQAVIEGRLLQLADVAEKVRRVRTDLGHGKTPPSGELALLVKPAGAISVAFDLPWPWGGEPFELRDIRPLNYIVGPLGSGKTRLAQRLAEALPDAIFLGLERSSDGKARALLDADPALKSRIDQTLNWLVEDGAKFSDALVILLVALEAQNSKILVIDMLEQGLDQSTQQALIAWLRRRAPDARPLFFLTRSRAVLDLDAVGSHETIILCPANHNTPTTVAPRLGARGYEAVASCLASPEVRARSEGVIAWRLEVA
jgi:DNA-binding transcriptional MerR regulator